MKVLCLLFLMIAAWPTYSQGVRTVVIDAGHGGKDPGAIGHKKSHEKDIVLNVSLLLGKYIEEYIPDVEVIYTRTTDEFIELHERANIANSNNADLFISIHANSTGTNTAPYGCETFVLGLHRTEANLEVAKRENSVISLEDNAEKHYDVDPNSPEGHIIMSLRQNAHLSQSIELAGLIQNQFRERVQRRDRGVKQAGFLVLYRTTMPSVLIELGFVSNPEEEVFLTSEQGQDYMASAIFRAFRDYKESMDAYVADKEEAERVNKEKEEVRKAQNENVVYRIQVYASRKKAGKRHILYKDFEDVLVEESSSGMFRHVVNEYDSYEMAYAALSDVIKKGYPDAFVVAYKDGKRQGAGQATSQLE